MRNHSRNIVIYPLPYPIILFVEMYEEGQSFLICCDTSDAFEREKGQI